VTRVTDGEQRAIVRVVPAGLVVRQETEAGGDGPYRERARTTLVVEAKRRGRVEARWPYAICGVVLVLVAALAGEYTFVLYLGGMLVASFLVARKTSPERVLAIADDHVQLAGGERLLLDDVRKVDVVRRHDEARNRAVACVVVHTPDAEVEVAGVDEPEQAEYIERLLDDAYRTFLRRRR
jgi:hypothetical protein